MNPKCLSDHIEVALVRPTYAGNIGAAARAMKNMGLTELALVNPGCDPLAHEALQMAYGAHDVLKGARVSANLSEVLSEARFVVGFTGHTFRGYEPPIPLPQAAPEILTQAKSHRVALLFGPEDSGLSQEEIVFCHRLATIPTPGPHASLNLAQAVLVVLYELTRKENPSAPSLPLKSATTADLEHLYGAWEALLVRAQMIRGRQGKSLLTRLRRILSRTSLTPEEVRMLQGILQQVNWYLDHPGK